MNIYIPTIAFVVFILSIYVVDLITSKWKFFVDLFAAVLISSMNESPRLTAFVRRRIVKSKRKLCLVLPDANNRTYLKIKSELALQRKQLRELHDDPPPLLRYLIEERLCIIQITKLDSELRAARHLHVVRVA